MIPTAKKSATWRTAFLGAADTGFVFALVGVLVGLRQVAIQTLPHIILPDTSLNFQEAAPGLPVPRLLDWNLGLIGWLLLVSQMGIVLLLLHGIFLYGGLWLRSLALLNPTFRLFRARRSLSVPAPTASALHETAAAAQTTEFPLPDIEPPILESPVSVAPELEASGVIKALWVLLPLAVLFAPLWIATFLAEGDGFPRFWALRMVTLGIALWVGFERRGMAGDFHERRWQKPGRSIGILLGKGILFGIGAALLILFAMPKPMEPTLLAYQALGTFHKGYWLEISVRYLLSLGAAWGGIGLLLMAIGQMSLRWAQRGIVLALVFASAFGAVWFQRPCTPAAMAARWDLTPQVRSAILSPYAPMSGGGIPIGDTAAAELASRAHLAIASPTNANDRSVLLFLNRVANVRQKNYTEDGLLADAGSAERVKEFLARRHYQTALSWMAIRHLYNESLMRFDPTDALGACLLDLTRCPHLSQCAQVTADMLFTCAATPQNLALLNTWADESQFTFADRSSRRTAGDTYVRFGETEKALQWYAKAEMPKTFLARVRASKPMFHRGQVRGRLLFNGSPLAGVLVGMLPKRLNGLPLPLEQRVLASDRAIVTANDFSELFPQYCPRPFAFRSLSAGAVTDRNGAFAFDYLTEGEYRLVCTLPANVKLTPPLDSRLTAANAPIAIVVNYAHPIQELGTIALTFSR